MITSKTSFIALIGNPVSHSLSPIMQNAALKYLGLDLIYIAIPCRDSDLELVLNSLKKINCVGLNITIPHKEKVFNLCSEISPIANKLKAINTLKLNSEKEWSATNTDVEGFIYPLKTINLTNRQSLVLGSGGAARSVIQGLINLNFSKIAVVSRNKLSLDKLIKHFGNQIEIDGLLNDHAICEKKAALAAISLLSGYPYYKDILDKNERILLQVKINEIDAANKAFEDLMGGETDARKKFIAENSLKVANLDI